METYSKCGLGVNPVSWKKHFSYPFIHIEVQYLLLWIFFVKKPMSELSIRDPATSPHSQPILVHMNAQLSNIICCYCIQYP